MESVERRRGDRTSADDAVLMQILKVVDLLFRASEGLASLQASALSGHDQTRASMAAEALDDARRELRTLAATVAG